MTAPVSYSQAAQTEEEAESEGLNQQSTRTDDEIAVVEQQARRRLCSVLVTVALAIACFAAWKHQTTLDFASIWGKPTNLNLWAFESSLSTINVVEREKGAFGSVFVVSLEESDRYRKQDPRPGESRSDFRKELGGVRMRIDQQEGILCLYRMKPWWFQASWATPTESMKPGSILILGRDSDSESYRLVLALILPDGDGFTSATFQPDPLNSTSLVLSSETGGRIAVYVGKGSDPYGLIAEGAAFGRNLASRSGAYPEVKSASKISRLPNFARYLGWCTWNAFYTNIDGSKVLDGVASLHDAQVPVRWMILDDGWQHTTNDSEPVIQQLELRKKERLAKLDSCPEKFRSDGSSLSLPETIRRLKLPKDKGGGGLEAVFGWHALLGYWLGIEPGHDDSTDRWRLPAATIHYPHFSSSLMDNFRDLKDAWSISLGTGVANDANDYFSRYYAYMMVEAGFDGVKADVQTISGDLRPFDTSTNHPEYQHRHLVASRVLDALSSSLKDFATEIDGVLPLINCMSHAPEFIYRIPSLFGPRLPLIRASDDFFPSYPESHGPMIVATSFNSLLLGHLATPDWDMFQSNGIPDVDGVPGHVASRFHAVARSISGGPIYISDRPEASNATLLNSVACEDGSLLPCSGVGLPVRSMLLRDPYGTEPFLIWNTNGIPGANVTSGVIGIFQLGETASASKTIELRPSDIEEFRGIQYANKSFVAFSYNTKNAWVIQDTNTSIHIEIPGKSILWSEVVSIVPFVTAKLYNSDLFFDLIPLGILDKFNSGGAVLRTQIVSVSSKKARARLSIRGCGTHSLLVRLRNTEHERDNLRSNIHGQLGHSLLNLNRDHLDATDRSPLHGLHRQGMELISFPIPCTDLGPYDEQWVTLDLEATRF